VADLSLLILTLLWGSSFWVVHETLLGVSAGVFLVLRFGIATVGGGIVVLARRARPTPGVYRDGALLGLSLFLGFLFQTEGLRFTTPARSGFLTGLSVLLVPLIERVLYRRSVPPRAWLGVLLALIGLGVLVNPLGELGAGVHLGDLLTTGCALAFSFQIIWTSEKTKGHELSFVTLVQVATTGILSLTILPFEDRSFAPTGAVLGALAYTGIVTTTLAYLVQNWAQRHVSATRAAILFTLEPLFAALVSHVIGGEPLGVGLLSGGALIVLGVLVVEVARAGTRAC
jgi:drug/metabolite transporter (DMT)-like permease